MRWRFLKQKRFLAALSLVVLVLFYNLTALGRVGDRAQEVFFYIGSPFWRAGRYLGSAWYGLTNSLTLQEKLTEQERVIAELTVANAEFSFLKDENRELRKLLGFGSGVTARVIPASVLAFSVFSGQSVIVVNQGSSSGIRENLAVVSPGGVLVGKVVNITPNTATILLTVDSDSSVAASLAKESSVQAIVKGKMGLSLQLDLVPQDTDIAIGDIIVTSSLEENTPPGLVIGKVAAVFYKEGELFKRANLEPLVSPLNIKIVGIILPSF